MTKPFILFALLLLATTGFAQRPATCVPGTGYFATDTRILYRCGPANVWTAAYSPKDGASIPPPAPVPTPTPLPPVDPCVISPLKLAGLKWPTAQTGSRSLSWNSSNFKIVSIAYAWPPAAVFTDDRGCKLSVKK